MTERSTSRTVSVLGAGNWGTTIAHLIGQNGYRVRLWARSAAAAEEINSRRTNERYLPGLSLSDNIEATSRLDEAVR
ncbi:MAG TPA: 2-dehydropantoate 2-reductase N-terminal domain-containing protein, partial [Enhygromyxa sp.]|nr:2-dehydropantoate 2-reductase N-terminal domain-containing protein [Enhygromyxa sp.]